MAWLLGCVVRGVFLTQLVIRSPNLPGPNLPGVARDGYRVASAGDPGSLCPVGLYEWWMGALSIGHRIFENVCILYIGSRWYRVAEMEEEE